LQAGAAAFDQRPAAGVAAVRAAMERTVAGESRAELDYADVCDPDTFEALAAPRPPALLAVAARVGPARLIDNVLLRTAAAGWEMGVRSGQGGA